MAIELQIGRSYEFSYWKGKKIGRGKCIGINKRKAAFQTEKGLFRLVPFDDVIAAVVLPVVIEGHRNRWRLSLRKERDCEKNHS